MFLRFISLCALISFLMSCSGTKKLTDLKTADWKLQVSDIILKDSIFKSSHTGLQVKEIGSQQAIIDLKSSHYFTPASNTKLLTFYTCLNVLGDQITGLKLFETEDSLIIYGTGDPSFQNPFLYVNDFWTERLNQSNKPLYFSTENLLDEHYGSGWSWDDYNYGYQTDKHSLPIHGNLVNFSKPLREDELMITPSFFKALSSPNQNTQNRTIVREEHQNIFHYDHQKLKKIYKVDRYVPYLVSDQLQAELLGEYLGRKVTHIESGGNIKEALKVQSIETDSLYRLLLQPSDNFIAEQLLLNCGSELFDTLNTRKVINWAREQLLKEMPHDFQWVDGSGLSRYNMTTPANMVHVLELIYSKVEKERLFRLLPTGGESGTIRKLYAADPPFIHAKTGSLRNNHSLSGYLIGDSGKIYVFSFMNSNYLVSNKELKSGMDRVLRILKSNL